MRSTTGASDAAWGKSAIGNNIFGIKALGNWTGKTQQVLTWEHVDGRNVQIFDNFRDYDCIADSFRDHFRFLDENSRYRAAGVFDADSDEGYFVVLKRAGYATDPDYAPKLSSILRTVKGYTARMECVEVDAPKGYEVKPDGNIVNPNPKDSSIIKDANRGAVSASTLAAVGAASPIVTAFAGMDWRLAAVIGGIMIAGGGCCSGTRCRSAARGSRCLGRALSDALAPEPVRPRGQDRGWPCDRGRVSRRAPSGDRQAQAGWPECREVRAGGPRRGNQEAGR